MEKSRKSVSSNEQTCFIILKFTCGVNIKDKGELVEGGEAASEKNWPWVASLRRDNNHFCGCVAIDSHVFLTAAHCLVG